MLLRMFSTDVAVRAEQSSQVLTKQLLAGVAVQLSKKLAGNEVREEQPTQAPAKLVPLDVSISGNEVREVQEDQAPAKLVPLDVSISGNELRETQRYQVS